MRLSAWAARWGKDSGFLSLIPALNKNRKKYFHTKTAFLNHRARFFYFKKKN